MGNCDTEAYNIALATLRERCQYLQEKLDVVENENCTLKLQLGQGSSAKSCHELPTLQEEMALFLKEKSQLTLKLQMLTKENKTLWARLSKVTSANPIVGKKVLVIADSLPENAMQVDNDIQSPKESLEEVSLKIFQDMLDRTELENQNDRYSKPDNFECLTFSWPQQESCSMNDNVIKHINKLNQFKNELIAQKTHLQNVFASAKTVLSGKTCRKCLHNSEVGGDAERDLVTLPLTGASDIGFEVTEGTHSDTTKICPMCGIKFSGPFPEFQNHVVTHFGDEEDQDISTFELVS